MRWIKLAAENFGPMTRWQADTDRDLVVFLGKNEAGKSTVMELILGLLFGYGNRKELRTRLISRDAGEAVISGEAVLDDGSRVTLQRTLKESGAVGVYTRNETAVPMPNAYPPVASLGRDMMQGAYALTQDQLKFPETRDWQQVQSQVLSGQVDPRLQPFSEADKKLLGDINSIWRPDNRGNTRWKEHQRALEEAGRAETEAVQRQTEISALYRENRNETERLAAAEDRRREAETFLRSAEYWNRLAGEEAVLARKQREAERARAFEALPADPGAEWAACRTRKEGLQREREELARRLAEAEAAREKAESPECVQLLQNRELLELIPGARVRMDEETHTLHSLEEGRKRAREELDETLEAVFPGCPEAAEKLVRLDGVRIQRRGIAVKEAEAALEQAAEALEAAPKAARRAGRGLTILYWFFAVLAAAFLAPGLYGVIRNDLSFTLLLLPAGGLILLFAIFLLAKSRREAKALHRAEDDLAEAEEALENADEDLGEVLAGLTLSERLMDNPGNIAGEIAACRKAANRLAAAEEAMRTVDDRLRRQKDALLRAVSMALPGREPDEQALQEVARKLEAAITAKYAADKAEEALPELLRRKAELEAEAGRLEAAEAALLKSLEGAEGETAEEKIAAVLALRQAAQQTEADIAAMEQKEPGAIAFIRARREDWPYSGEAMEAARKQKEQAEADMRNSTALQAQRREKARHLEALTTPSEAAARKNQILERMEKDRRERDSGALALALIRLAYRRFREENQPALIRRASALMAMVTDGRYDRLALTEDEQGLLVRLSETGEWLDPEKSRLSKGTLEQLYICLRLALAERLDPGETLPISLDETLVNWDADRIRRGLSMVVEFSRNRQVFFFTCHPWMVELLREQTEDFGFIEL
ncbi:MAG: AAA family ATPase [Christensenellales bacterium]|jgi:uncharacterized protein YhaN